MRNGTDLGGTLAAPGIGRQNNSVTPNTAQNIVANGLAFDREGDLFIADTARGAIWKVELRGNGTLKSATGCDTTFTADTLCLDAIFVAHPYLEGADGIALDREGNIWVATNERNAIVVVTRQRVVEVFRHPGNPRGLANPTGPGNRHHPGFPARPFPAGPNVLPPRPGRRPPRQPPNTGGEVNAGGPVGARGKISCMDQPLRIPGLP